MRQIKILRIIIERLAHRCNFRLGELRRMILANDIPRKKRFQQYAIVQCFIGTVVKSLGLFDF